MYRCNGISVVHVNERQIPTTILDLIRAPMHQQEELLTATAAAADAASGSAVGIKVFLDDSAGRVVVLGAIKSRPEDFVVREISALNEAVTLTDKSERLPMESERDAVLQTLVAAQTATQKAKKERMVFEEPASGWHPALIEKIGTEGFALVESVANCNIGECFLAAPTEFQDRVFLQVCIQMHDVSTQNCFPGLDCKMQQTETPEQQIQVLLDPVYQKFREGGMSPENCDRLLVFLRKGANDPEAAKGLELEHEDSKTARTMLHRLISKHSSCFKTKTESRNGIQRLVVQFSQKNTKKRKRSQPQVHLQFVLQKTNQEHFACFDHLARSLSRPLSAFSYSGTKDKAAVTFQHVVVSGVTPERLLAINQDAASGIRVGNLQFVGAPMALGGAKGNRFAITIRELSCKVESSTATIRSTLKSALESVKHRGFVNYFGFQRVGLPSSAVRPHHIGEKIIAGKWEEAARLLLAPDDCDSEIGARAKRIYLETQDVEAALKLMPFSMSAERHVLQGLKRFGADAFEQAVKTVPFSRRVMFMHAYQSYLFNQMASFRLRHYGAKLVAGDLIQCEAQGENAASVKIVSAEEAEEFNRDREDALALALLPLPGTNVMLPSNATKEACIKTLITCFLQMMEQDGTKDALLDSGPVKGAYRTLIAFPQDLEWTWEEQERKSVLILLAFWADERTDRQSALLDLLMCLSTALALQLSFSLASGCFATMCLREVLNSDI
ncbi:hypothetical protein BBJ28_00000222 [Nothophytophthora sp. Chile5]|nr:hypothetical protein BBJ28_00000222 [Nothophytophthora sp. Chile5]